MKTKAINQLYFAYYGIICLALIVATLLIYLLKKTDVQLIIDRQSATGVFIQYFVIFYVILSVPGMLYWFKKECDKLKLIADEQAQTIAYRNRALTRILIIGMGMIFGLVAFYILGGYNSMLWCAAISAIGLVFCKPNIRRMELELLNENPEI